VGLWDAWKIDGLVQPSFTTVSSKKLAAAGEMFYGCQFIYGSTAFADLGRFFSFLIHTQSVFRRKLRGD
jgi:hypothetical protein